MIGRRSSYRLFACGVPKACRAGRSGAPWQLGGLAGRSCVDTGMRRPTTMGHASGLVDVHSGQLYLFRLAALVRRVPTIFLGVVLISWVWYQFLGSGGNSWRQYMYISSAAVIDRLKADTQDFLVWFLINRSVSRWRPPSQPNTTGSLRLRRLPSSSPRSVTVPTMSPTPMPVCSHWHLGREMYTDIC